jgi:hypothetical protein
LACEESDGEITYRDEREVEDCPDDVELPVQAFDARRRNFDD